MDQGKKPAPAALVKFKTDYTAKTIVPVKVLRETTACVFLVSLGYSKSSERREAKMSDYAQYHDTWADAHAYLLDKGENDVKELRRQLELASGRLGNIKGMKPPKVGT